MTKADGRDPGIGKPCALRDTYIGAYREVEPIFESEDCFPAGPSICEAEVRAGG